MIVQFAGLLVAISSFSSIQLFVGSAVQVNSFEGAAFFMAYILVTAAIILLIMKFYHGNLVYLLLESLVVLFASTFLFFMVLNDIFQSVAWYYIAAASAIAALSLIIAKSRMPRLRNLIAITSSIGVGVVIGLNGFALAYILTLFIAAYDYIAVFITKHMVTMAKEISSRNLAFLIGSTDVEAMPSKYLSKSEVLEFKKQEKSHRISDPALKGLMNEGIMPIISQVQLGTGDLAIPLMVAVSAYISFINYIIPVAVVIGSTCGLVFTMYLLKRYKVVLPAIPPIFAFINLSLGIVFAATGTGTLVQSIGFIIISIFTLAILMLRLNGGAKVRKP
jgi:presenilin-like A22 family membrane protease